MASLFLNNRNTGGTRPDGLIIAALGLNPKQLTTEIAVVTSVMESAEIWAGDGEVGSETGDIYQSGQTQEGMVAKNAKVKIEYHSRQKQVYRNCEVFCLPPLGGVG